MLMVILCGLPIEYKVVKEIIHTWGPDMTIESICSQLHQHEAQLLGSNAKSIDKAEEHNSALYTSQPKPKCMFKPHDNG